MHDDEEHQQGSQSLQRAHEQVAQNADSGCGGDHGTQNGTHDQTHDDALDKTDLVPSL